MKKLFFKKTNYKLYYILFLFVVFGFLLFNLIPSIGKGVSKLAVFSSKMNFSKNIKIGDCFKKINLEEQQNNLKVQDNRTEILNVENNVKEQPIGPICRRCYEPLKTNKFINLEGTAFVRNMTNLPNDVILRANQKKPAFNLENTNEPQVLIYHTHTTECYESVEKDQYDKKVPTRSKDTKLNVVGVGQEIVKQLEMRGIKAIHDMNIYDDPAYSGAYDRTNMMINNILKKHKKIKVVLDIHRDSITNQQKERIAPITMVNGQKVAQLMIISGCDNGSNHYKNYEKNLSFACALEKQVEKDFPKLTRPVSFKYKHYNQSLSPGALLIEIGSQANSVQEARLCGMYFGTSLSNLLLKLRTSEPLKKQEEPKNQKKGGQSKVERLKNEKPAEQRKSKPKQKESLKKKIKQIKNKKQEKKR